MKLSKSIIHTFIIGCGLSANILLSCCAEESLTINVIEAERPLVAEFIWRYDSIQLEIPNNWSLTRFRNRAAVTNFEEKTQYFLYWEGGMTDGEKSNALLKVGKQGQAAESIELDHLSVQDMDGMFWRIKFRKGYDKGILTFSK